MAVMTSNFWGIGPHTLYHGFGQDVVIGVYDAGSREEIKEAIVKNWWGSVEVTLPYPPVNGCLIVVIG